jgi:hypothetical protein
MLSSSDPVGVKAKWVGRVGDLLHGASITAKWGKYGVAPRIHRLSSLPEIIGGGYADVLRYFKCPPTNKIR